MAKKRYNMYTNSFDKTADNRKHSDSVGGYPNEAVNFPVGEDPAPALGEKGRFAAIQTETKKHHNRKNKTSAESVGRNKGTAKKLGSLKAFGR